MEARSVIENSSYKYQNVALKKMNGRNFYVMVMSSTEVYPSRHEGWKHFDEEKVGEGFLRRIRKE